MSNKQKYLRVAVVEIVAIYLTSYMMSLPMTWWSIATVFVGFSVIIISPLMPAIGSML